MMPPKKCYLTRSSPKDMGEETEETEVIPETQDNDGQAGGSAEKTNKEADIDNDNPQQPASNQQPQDTRKRWQSGGASDIPEKKRKRPCNFSDQEENDLVARVRDNPIFYVRTSKEYKDSATKKLLWEGKAKQLGVDLDVLLTWYKSLSTKLGKLTQNIKKSGEGHAERTDRDRWILERFDFLVKHIQRVKGKVGASVMTRSAAAKPLGPDSPVESSDSEDEDEDPLSWPTSHASSSGQPSSQPQLSTSTQPYTTHTRSDSPSASTSAAMLAHKTRKGEKSKDADREVLDLHRWLVEEQETSQNLQAQVRVLQQAEEARSCRSTWGAWISSMMPSIHDSLMQVFMQESFKLVMNSVSQSNIIRSRELQMSSQPVQSAPPGPVSQQQQQPFQQVQRPQQQPAFITQIIPASSNLVPSRLPTPSTSTQQVSRGGGSASPVISWATPGPSSTQRITPRQLPTDSANTSGLGQFLQDISFSVISTSGMSPFDLGGDSAPSDGGTQ